LPAAEGPEDCFLPRVRLYPENLPNETNGSVLPGLRPVAADELSKCVGAHSAGGNALKSRPGKSRRLAERSASRWRAPIFRLPSRVPGSWPESFRWWPDASHFLCSLRAFAIVAAADVIGFALSRISPASSTSTCDAASRAALNAASRSGPPALIQE